jgi:hypothetical protein
MARIYEVASTALSPVTNVVKQPESVADTFVRLMRSLEVDTVYMVDLSGKREPQMRVIDIRNRG